MIVSQTWNCFLTNAEPIEKYGFIHYIGKLEVGNLKYIYIYIYIYIYKSIYLYKVLRRKNKSWKISIGN